MGVIATLLPTASHLQRLRAAIRDRHRVVVCDGWVALTALCAENRSGWLSWISFPEGGHGWTRFGA